MAEVKKEEIVTEKKKTDAEILDAVKEKYAPFTTIDGKPILSNEYIQAVRVEQAKRLLELGDVTIKSLAHQVGYDDISSFTRLFKRATELTPKEYQDKYSRLAI